MFLFVAGEAKIADRYSCKGKISAPHSMLPGSRCAHCTDSSANI